MTLLLPSLLSLSQANCEAHKCQSQDVECCTGCERVPVAKLLNGYPGIVGCCNSYNCEDLSQSSFVYTIVISSHPLLNEAVGKPGLSVWD